MEGGERELARARSLIGESMDAIEEVEVFRLATLDEVLQTETRYTAEEVAVAYELLRGACYRAGRAAAA